MKGQYLVKVGQGFGRDGSGLGLEMLSKVSLCNQQSDSSL